MTALIALSMIAGVLPTMHHHEHGATAESHCHDVGPQIATHVDALETAHHEPCGLCVKSFSPDRPGPPQTTSVDDAVAARGPERSQALPASPPGRDGASRAPPAARA